MIRLSFVIPAYKVEAIIGRCLDSIYAQDLSNSDFEIIVVDDGSPDNLSEICRSYQSRYGNIVYVRQENQGQGSARNKGMELAQGKYLMFVDADDFLEPHTLKSVIDCTEKNAAEMCFFRSRFSPDDGEVLNCQPFELGKVYTGEYILLHGMHVSSVWGNIYLTDYLRKSNVKFIPGVFSEDIDFNYCLYPSAKRVVFSDVVAYNYSRDVESSTHTQDMGKLRKVLLDTIIVNRHVLDFCADKNFSEELITFYNKRVNSSTASSLLNLFMKQKKYDNNIIFDYLKMASEMSLYPIKGKTLSRRLDTFVPFLNCRSLYLFIAKAIRHFLL